MKIVKVKVARTFALGNGELERIELEADIDEERDDNPFGSVAVLRDAILLMHGDRFKSGVERRAIPTVLEVKGDQKDARE